MTELQKVLTKLSKEKGCEIIGRWKQACVRHFYWSVTSTSPKLGDVVLAKFKAFLYHIINQHKDLPNQLFNKCAHGLVTTQRVWLTKGICQFNIWSTHILNWMLFWHDIWICHKQLTKMWSSVEIWFKLEFIKIMKL